MKTTGINLFKFILLLTVLLSAFALGGCESQKEQTTATGNEQTTAIENEQITVTESEQVISDNQNAAVSPEPLSDWHIGGAALYLTQGVGDIHVSYSESSVLSEPSVLEAEETDDNEYENFAIARISHYVNVRSEANTDSDIVGKMYDGAVAEVVGSTEEADGEWLCIKSGSVEGYIKAEYFIYGEAATEVIEDYLIHKAKVIADRLNVRKEPSTEASRIGYLDKDETVEILENNGEWLLVRYTDEKTGYVAAEYTILQEEYITAVSIEEEKRAEEEERKKRQREQADAAVTGEVTYVAPPINTSYATTAELRQAIVDYAMQYIGYPYVHGGQSLATGTDCSGFTCYIFKEFGYSLSRTPHGQYTSAGRAISLSELQIGDIVCYGDNKCTHVGIYIGNNQIVHAANKKKGVITSKIDYMSNCLGARNVID